ncbi:MAG: TraR/DksA family transcriptional regulator [Bryobacterales bacterium]
MSKKQMNKTREQLLTKLAELTGNSPRLDEYLGDWSNDPMDQVQSRADMDMAVSFVNTGFETKRAIKKALARLDAGDYGICEDCEEEINPKRLEAIPWTTMCVNCREAHDEQEANLRKAA